MRKAVGMLYLFVFFLYSFTNSSRKTFTKVFVCTMTYVIEKPRSPGAHIFVGSPSTSPVFSTGGTNIK